MMLELCVAFLQSVLQLKTSQHQDILISTYSTHGCDRIIPLGFFYTKWNLRIGSVRPPNLSRHPSGHSGSDLRNCSQHHFYIQYGPTYASFCAKIIVLINHKSLQLGFFRDVVMGNLASCIILISWPIFQGHQRLLNVTGFV